MPRLSTLIFLMLLGLTLILSTSGGLLWSAGPATNSTSISRVASDFSLSTALQGLLVGLATAGVIRLLEEFSRRVRKGPVYDSSYSSGMSAASRGSS